MCYPVETTTHCPSKKPLEKMEIKYSDFLKLDYQKAISLKHSTRKPKNQESEKKKSELFCVTLDLLPTSLIRK